MSEQGPDLSRSLMTIANGATLRHGTVCCRCGKSFEVGERKWSFKVKFKKGGPKKNGTCNVHWCCACNRYRNTDILDIVKRRNAIESKSVRQQDAGEAEVLSACQGS